MAPVTILLLAWAAFYMGALFWDHIQNSYPRTVGRDIATQAAAFACMVAATLNQLL